MSEGTPLTIQDFAQKFTTNQEEAAKMLAEIVIPTRTAAQLGDINDSINQESKRQGRMCYTSDGNLLHVAQGSAPGDTWTEVGNATTPVPDVITPS